MVKNYLENFFNIPGKIVAITGAGGHLCGAMALGLAKAGAKIIAMDVRPQKLDEIKEEIEKSDGECLCLAIDVKKKEDFQNTLNKSIERFGRVDVLINGSGINAPTPVLDISEEEWGNILDVNLRGTLFGCQVYGRHMIERKKGSIINISSASAGPPLSKAFTYSVSKAGVKNLTQNLAREWAPFNVRVNALRPGFFPTEWNRKNFITKDRETAILGHTPMKRFGEPAELLGAVLWLASEASNFVTGAEISVDGGFSAMTI
jgi:NAD(P)-dependent dehydrogenase (short-subunit alcohol dehydrogenase family)